MQMLHDAFLSPRLTRWPMTPVFGKASSLRCFLVHRLTGTTISGSMSCTLIPCENTSKHKCSCLLTPSCGTIPVRLG